MTHKLAARVGAQSAVVGTAAVTFGAALAAHKAFGAVLATGDTTEYLLYACDASGAATGAWEVGVGTYHGPEAAGGERLERTTVHENSAGTAVAIDFAAGDKRVVITPLASRLAMIPPGGAEGQMLALDAATGKLKWVAPPTGGGGTSYLPLPDFRLFLFVRADGNDANTGLANTPEAALATLDAALAKVYTYDVPEGDTATITFAAGTGFSSFGFTPPAGDGRNFTISIEADGTGDVVFSTLSLGIDKQLVEISGVKVGSRLVLRNAEVYDTQVGVVGEDSYQSQIVAETRGDGVAGVVALYNCKVAGNAPCRFEAQGNATLNVGNVEILGAPATSDAVIKVGRLGEVSMGTVTGTTTGKKFTTEVFGVVRSSAGAASLPGTVDGDLAPGAVLS